MGPPEKSQEENWGYNYCLIGLSVMIKIFCSVLSNEVAAYNYWVLADGAPEGLNF